MDESFQKVMNKSLNAQLANGLKDPSHAISARAIIKQDPNMAFAEFRADLATIFGCQGRVSGKGVSSSAVLEDSSPETPVPVKGGKRIGKVKTLQHSYPCVYKTIVSYIRRLRHLIQQKSQR